MFISSMSIVLVRIKYSSYLGLFLFCCHCVFKREEEEFSDHGRMSNSADKTLLDTSYVFSSFHSSTVEESRVMQGFHRFDVYLIIQPTLCT